MKVVEMVLVLLLKKKVMLKSSVAGCGFPSIPGDSDSAAAAGARRHKILAVTQKHSC